LGLGLPPRQVETPRLQFAAMSQLSIRKHNASFAGLFAGAVLLLSPIPAHADAGIPMLPIAYPVILLFLVPVIAIEALYLRLRLHTGWKDTWAATSKANLVTMLLGYPLAWLVYLGLEYGLAITGVTDHLSWAPGTHIASILDIVTTAAWMGPENGGTLGHWPIPLAFVVLLIPSFVLSGFIESFLLGRRGWLHYEGRSTRFVWQANLLSYIFLAVAGAILFWNVVGNY
jgi:hypothetical protein